MRDFKRMQTDPPEGVNGAPCDNDIMKWHAVIFGCAAARAARSQLVSSPAGPSCARPEDTPWEDGTFKLSVEFTEEYPNKAPNVKFMTKMFHPNSARRRAAACRACPACTARAVPVWLASSQPPLPRS